MTDYIKIKNASGNIVPVLVPPGATEAQIADVVKLLGFSDWERLNEAQLNQERETNHREWRERSMKK